MQPLINPTGKHGKKDRVFILRQLPFKSIEETVQHGDVVSLISPKNLDECFIKRVIGLPGDVVKTINYKKNYVVVPQGHCWIEGDNHKSSYDSNRFGCIPMGLILGKAKVLKAPCEYRLDMRQYLMDFVNSFSQIKSSLPESRKLIKLKPGQNLLKAQKLQKNNLHHFFIDYQRLCKSNEMNEKESVDQFSMLDVIDGVLSEEVFNEINDKVDDEEILSFQDSESDDDDDDC